MIFGEKIPFVVTTIISLPSFIICAKKKETSFSSCKVVLLHRKSDTIIRWWEHSQLIDHSYRILHRCASCQVLRDFPLEFRWQEVNPCRAQSKDDVYYVRPCGFFFWKKNQAIWRRIINYVATTLIISRVIGQLAYSRVSNNRTYVHMYFVRPNQKESFQSHVEYSNWY